MAGVLVNEKAETTIPGLYAAGDAASVPKQHLTGAFVFGEVAAEQAVAFVSEAGAPGFRREQVDALQHRRERLAQRADRRIDVREFEYKVRRLIGDYCVSPKNHYKLQRWAEWAERFRGELEGEVLAEQGHDLSKLYEVEHILTCAGLSAAASMYRKESRWGEAHFRSDFPERDDRNYFCHVVVRRGEAEEDIQVTTKPIIGLDGREVRS
jgi:succinate dehydrogenase/fumarate reductase flavoprotein subunit